MNSILTGKKATTTATVMKKEFHVRGDREANAMVRMQTYLSLFARIEHDSGAPCTGGVSSPGAREESAWGMRSRPRYAHLLEYLGRTAGSMSEAEAVFKLGELLQLRRELVTSRLACQHPTSLRCGIRYQYIHRQRTT